MTPSSRNRRIVRLLGVLLLLLALPLLCWPRPDSLRVAITAEIARRMDTPPELVELEWLETHATGPDVAFEALARVSESQPGDLHALGYRASGVATADGKLRQMHLDELSDAPPEPRP